MISLLKKQNRLLVLIGVVILLILNLGISVRSIYKLDDFRYWVSHSQQVLLELESISSSVVEAESGARGYVITGNEDFLEPYFNAVTHVHGHVEKLKQLTSFSAVEYEKVEPLERAIRKQLNFINECILVQKALGNAAVIKKINTKQGKMLMDEIKGHVSFLKSTENKFLEERTEEANLHTNSTFLTFLLSANISIILLCVLYYLINKFIRDQENAGRMLEESEKQYRTLVQKMNEGLTQSDINGVLEFVNDRFCEMTGYSRQELIGNKAEDVLLVEDDRDFLRKKILARQEGIADEYELRVRKKSGEFMIMHVNGSPLFDSSGKVTGSIGILNDVTEKMVAEQKLRDSEGRYRLMFEQNPMPMWVYDTESLELLAVNEAAIYKYGYSREEFLSMTLAGLHIERDIPLLTTLSKIAEEMEGINYSRNWKHKRKDGAVIDVEITTHSLLFKNRKSRLVLANDITVRKQAEESLLKSEERYKKLVETSPDGIFIHIKGKIVFVNQTAINMLGALSEEELLEKDLMEFIPIHHREIVKKQLILVQEERRELPLTEGKMTKVDGTEMDIEMIATPVLFNEEEGVQAIVRDITGRKEAERTIRESEEKYRKVVESSPHAIVIHSQAVIVFVNPAGVKLFRTQSEKDLLGKSLFDFISSDKHLEVRERIETLIKNPRTVLEHTNKIRTADDTILDVEVASLLTVYNNSPAIFSMLTDISSRIETEGKLRKSEELYRTLVENMNEGLIQVDNDDRILFVNRKLCELTGYMKEELIGKVADEIFIDEADQKIIRQKIEARKKGVSDHYEIKLRKKNGDYVHMLISGSPLYKANGEVAGSVGIQTDITDRIEAEEKLKALNEELNNFIYRTSHDLKGPLASIQGVVNLARKEISDETANNYLSIIGEATRRLSSALSELIETVRVKKGDLTPSQINFDELLKDVIGSLTHLNGKNKTRIETEVSIKNPFYSDVNVLTSLIQNLVENAIKYRREDVESFVKISVAAEKNGIRIEVEDNGTGVPKDLQEKIFDMFFRANSKVPGSGLGLYIVKTGAEKLGGNVKISSDGKSCSRFTAWLPNLANRLKK